MISWSLALGHSQQCWIFTFFFLWVAWAEFPNSVCVVHLGAPPLEVYVDSIMCGLYLGKYQSLHMSHTHFHHYVKACLISKLCLEGQLTQEAQQLWYYVKLLVPLVTKKQCYVCIFHIIRFPELVAWWPDYNCQIHCLMALTKQS